MATNPPKIWIYIRFFFKSTTVRGGCAKFSLRLARTYKLNTFSTGVEFQGFRNEMTVYTDSSLDAIKRQNYQNKYRNDQITSKNFHTNI